MAPKPPDGAYDLQDGTIVAGKKKFARLGAGDFSNEKLSPSGKWAVIGGNISEGDYIDRSLYLDQNIQQLLGQPFERLAHGPRQ